MSHQEYVGMQDLFFASPMMLAAWHASMPPHGIGFLLLSSDEEGRNALLVPIGPNDLLNHIAGLTSQSDRFRCHVRFVSPLTLILIASPLLFTCCPPGDLVRVAVRLPGHHLEGKASDGLGARAHTGISA